MAMTGGLGYMCNTVDSVANRSNNAYVEPLKLGPSWTLPQPLMVRAATCIRRGDEITLRYNLAPGSPLHKLISLPQLAAGSAHDHRDPNIKQADLRTP